jgi:CheY-like chemotaxis protein
MSGTEATRIIKRSARGATTVVIALTASGLEEDRSAILAEGCDDYIRKPFREAEIYGALSRHLGVRFVVQENGGPGQVGEGRSEPAPGANGWAAQAAQSLDGIARVPAALLEALRQATLVGDVTAIEERSREIEKLDPSLAALLQQWARHFEHERILELIERAGSSTHEEPLPAG